MSERGRPPVDARDSSILQSFAEQVRKNSDCTDAECELVLGIGSANRRGRMIRDYSSGHKNAMSRERLLAIGKVALDKKWISPVTWMKIKLQYQRWGELDKELAGDIVEQLRDEESNEAKRVQELMPLFRSIEIGFVALLEACRRRQMDIGDISETLVGGEPKYSEEFATKILAMTRAMRKLAAMRFS